MKIGVALTSALEALIANPLRSFLTMLGIMIGVASVMAMMAISQGAAQQVDAQIASLGASILTARPGARRQGGRSLGANASQPFNDKIVKELKNEPYAAAVAVRNAGAGNIVAGDSNWQSSIYGVNTDYFTAQQWELDSGNLFSEKQVNSGAAVAIIGKTIATNLFAGTNPLEQSIRVNNVPLRIIGLLEEKGQSNFGQDRDDIVIIPISTARNRVLGSHPTMPKHVDRIELSVRPGYDMSKTQTLLEERLRELRRIKVGGDNNFRVYNVADFIRARSSTQNTMGILLAFTAAVSLIVGGVGVMNIMLVSVTERTREIGLRMAVGARKNDILGQFLAEAIALCLLGGLIGTALGVGAARLAAKLGNFPVNISPQIALVALGAAAIIGIAFGFFPARRAAQLNPIEALRSE